MEQRKLGKLSVDNLILKYMIEKVRLGYEPSYTIDEFMLFLNYFRQHRHVYDVIDDGDKLFDRFFERKSNNWFDFDYYGNRCLPHIVRSDNGILIATYNLNHHDDIDFLGTKEKKNVEAVIESFLKQFSKRSIDMGILVSDDNKFYGQAVASLLVNSIWNSYCKIKADVGSWPSQCFDINKYLLDVDLASIINLPSIREDILTFYEVVSERIAVMIENDSKLLLSTINVNSEYLANANYRCVVDGYNELLEWCNRVYNFKVDLDRDIFKATCYYHSVVSDSIFNLNGKYTRKLVHSLNWASIKNN